MKYNELQLNRQTKKNRVGRGISAGQGKTAGRGTKGQGARTGSRKKPGFAGGSNPLMQKLPKLPGFRSHKVKAEVVYLSQLDQFNGKTVDAMALFDAGLTKSAYSRIKLLSKGNLKKKVTVKLPEASLSAIAAIESVGGSFEKTDRMSRPESKKKSDKKSDK
jgi:large subunit ribosomal protein L15